MTNDIRIPAVISGQVLKQYGGYYVRGQYVIGWRRSGDGTYFWYDIYDRRNGGHGLADAQAALNAVATFITESGK